MQGEPTSSLIGLPGKNSVSRTTIFSVHLANEYSIQRANEYSVQRTIKFPTKIWVASIFTLLLFTPLISPVTAEWEEDSWLVNIIGPERLELGDEFGCHGMVGEQYRSFQEEVSECRVYLEERIHASKWGSNALSLGVKESHQSDVSTDLLVSEEFLISDTQFSSEEVGLNSIEYNGGSLEKNIGSIENFDQLLGDDVTQINFYWQGRDHDVVVRPETELVSAIESTTAWFTTWGEQYSYERNLELFNLTTNTPDEWGIEFESLEIESSPLHWDVPITNKFANLAADVVHVKVDGVMLAELTTDSLHLMPGWRQTENDLFITLERGTVANVQFESSAIGEISQSECLLFNCHSVAITVAGHNTDDLFDWSRRWDDSPLRFTWLVTPRLVEEYNWFLPAVALLTALAAPIAIIWLVKNDRRAQQAVAVLNSLDNLKFEEE